MPRRTAWPVSTLAAALALLAAGCGGAREQAPDLSKYDIAFVTNRDGNYEIYTMRADGSGVTRLTDDPASDFAPRWSPDGARIAFNSDRDGDFDIYVMDADGSELVNVTADGASNWDPCWSPDGAYLMFGSDQGGDRAIHSIQPDGTGRARIAVGPWNDFGPALSPDGEWIAFLSNRHDSTAAGNEIHVMHIDGTDPAPLTHDRLRHSIPSWSADGTRITYTLHPPDPGDGSLTDDEIYAISREGGLAVNLTRNPASDEHAFASADGRLIVFDSTRDGGELQLYVMNPDGSNPRRVSTSTGMDFWSSIIRR
jgi:Tol biopolymer transport system component